MTAKPETLYNLDVPITKEVLDRPILLQSFWDPETTAWLPLKLTGDKSTKLMPNAAPGDPRIVDFSNEDRTKSIHLLDIQDDLNQALYSLRQESDEGTLTISPARRHSLPPLTPPGTVAKDRSSIPHLHHRRWVRGTRFLPADAGNRRYSRTLIHPAQGRQQGESKRA